LCVANHAPARIPPRTDARVLVAAGEQDEREVMAALDPTQAWSIDTTACDVVGREPLDLFSPLSLAWLTEPAGSLATATRGQDDIRSGSAGHSASARYSARNGSHGVAGRAAGG